MLQKYSPILECFFIIYKIMNEDISFEKKLSKSESIKGIYIQKISDLPEKNLNIEQSFTIMKNSKADIEELIFFIAEKNKKVFYNKSN